MGHSTFYGKNPRRHIFKNRVDHIMKHMIRKCLKCFLYTLKPLCDRCGAPTVDAHPARYSPDDKYARYRIADRYVQPDIESNPTNNA